MEQEELRKSPFSKSMWHQLSQWRAENKNISSKLMGTFMTKGRAAAHAYSLWVVHIHGHQGQVCQHVCAFSLLISCI